MASYRFGKHPPRVDYRSLRLKNYLKSTLAPPPATCDVLGRVYANLKSSDPTALFPMDGNDQLSDCTIAAVAHALTVYWGLTGKKTILTQPVISKVYFHLTGGIDSGLAELDVLNYWRQTGVGNEKILGYVTVDPKNHGHVQQAIQLFGGVYLGFQVPKDCMQQFDARQPWTAGPLTRDGHAVYAVGYTAQGVTVLTWGNTQQGTWGWWDECVDEAYAILPSEAKAKDFSPGLDFEQLQSDIAAVAN
jgi:hypothetical protein